MSYSQFTLNRLKTDFGLAIQEGGSLYAEPPELHPSSLLSQTLQDYLPLALAINSEKARSEFILAPILGDLRRQIMSPISLFSGKEFNVDPVQGLVGFCDFILCRSSEQLFIEAPVLIIVEAKNENIIGGLGQCAAAMLAAQIFNGSRQQSFLHIYGCVTTGNVWRFLRLEGSNLAIDNGEYYIKELPKILGILSIPFSE
ncbi:MAG: hypothetical protein HC838_02425 [Spirulinaceae cyanobacterium RM2_2_10]|nr:hypothetical protein [Spirulinaceae cyanobacterium SM2_1_0]NJO19144.1 hypothetical protein [Spirulinaceae cyanobacterium RM2_2_10]